MSCVLVSGSGRNADMKSQCRIRSRGKADLRADETCKKEQHTFLIIPPPNIAPMSLPLLALVASNRNDFHMS